MKKNISTRQDILSNIKNISQESTMLRLINDLNSNFKNLQLEFMVQKNIINDRKRRLTTMETRSFVIVPKGIFQDMFDFYRILTNFNDKLMDSIEFKINEDIDNVLYSIRTFHSDLSDQIKGKIDNPSNKPSNYNEQVFKNVERTLEKYSSDYIRLLRDMLNTAIIIRNTGQQVIKSNYVVCREVLILSKAKSYLK